MLDSVKFIDSTLIYFSAILAVLFAASYAGLLIHACVKSLARMRMMAYAAYAGLVFSAITLAFSINLFVDGNSIALVFLLLVGYFLAPHVFLRLNPGMRADAKPDPALETSRQH